MAVSRLASWRLPGCGAGCSLRWHAPEDHERYGREQERTRLRPARIGPLVIDYTRLEVRIEDRRVSLTDTETRLLMALVGRIGEVVGRDALLHTVWGPAYVGEYQLLLVNISRLRARLREAGRLIETRFGRGYLLRAMAPCSVAEMPPDAPWMAGGRLYGPRQREALELLAGRVGERLMVPDLAVALHGRVSHSTRKDVYETMRGLQSRGVALTIQPGQTQAPRAPGWVRLDAPLSGEATP